MKLKRNVFQIKIMCPIQLQLCSVTELWPFDCVFMLILYFTFLYMPELTQSFGRTMCQAQE